MELTIGKKLGLGFGTVLALATISAGITCVEISRMVTSEVDLTEYAFPAESACKDLLNGLNHSTAALRGYVILGDDPKESEFFKADRARAWKSMEEALAKLNELYKTTADANEKRNLGLVQSNLEDLRKLEQEVEDIAQTDKNVPAVQMMLAEGAPKADKLLAAVTAIIDAEESLEATAERKTLLKTLGDFRTSFMVCRTNIRDFMEKADPRFKLAFETQWKLNQQAFEVIESQNKLLEGRQPDRWEEAKKARSEYEPLSTQMFTLRMGEGWNRACYLQQKKSAPKALALRDALDVLQTSARTRADASDKSLESAGDKAFWTLLIATFAAIVVGSGVALFLSRGIAAAVSNLLAAVKAVAAGDLTGQTVRVTSRDELGQLAEGLNQMVSSLRNILSETTTMTGEVAASSNEISAASQQQVATLNQTATSLNQITATAEEFKATMQEFVDRARAVKEAADETAKRSADGRLLTQDSATRIDQVRSNSQAAGQSVLNLSEQMQRIGEITATVNEIAEQTKLLALNASIEAARAGEEGRGFAVVATQVRELANQSKEAAGRIESLIADTQKSMQDVVNKIEDGSRLSQDSTDIVRRVTSAFDEIVQAIEQTREAMVQINTGAREQEGGIAQLVSSIAQIDVGSKESLTAAEQTQKAILAIDQRIRALNQSVARFKT